MMKSRLNIFGLLFVAGLSYAQITGLSANENYIYTKNCLNEDCSKKIESVEYSDDLGRARQVINIKGSPSGKDIVIPIEYDAFGRQVKSYLPIPQAGTQNGAAYADPKSNASQTYGSDPYFYSSTVLESSPVGKVLSRTRPGADYQGHSVSYGYEVNSTGEVKKYVVTTAWANKATDNSISMSGTYNTGELVKTSVTDEDGNTTIEYTNGKGQAILARKVISSTENADTYYVYNKYGQLAYVIPPLASAAPTLTLALLNELCYQYRYDSKNRLVEKKLPGKGWEYMVYDKQDRLVMSQDANMGASKQWLFTKYDKFGRAAYTGTYISSQNYGSAGREFEQSQVDASTLQNEARDTGGFTATGVTAYYTNAVYPTAFTKVLSLNYYDTYPADGPSRPAQILGKNTIGDNPGSTINTKNLPTASYVKNIEDDHWTKSYVWYDEKARAIGSYSINHLGGYTKTESLLDFAGVPQLSKVYHKRLSSDTEKVITQTFEYDSRNRLKKQWHQVDGNAPELLAENSYNELSQLANKKVGNNLQSIDYTYNIRGALTKINDPENLNGKLFGYQVKYNNPVYSNLAPAKYNGSITEVDWKTANDGVLRRYSYDYDPLNRLKKGIYSEPDASVPQNGLFNETISYDANGNITALSRNSKGISGTAELIDNLTYSYKGNKLSAVTDASTNYRGYPDTSGNLIVYDNNGNMKNHVDKGILQIDYNLLNLPDKITFDKTYLVRDLVTGGFNTYNVTTKYTYDSGGTKLRKEYTYGGIILGSEVFVTTDYLNGFQYETENTSPSILKFVPTSEGYYDFVQNRYIYHHKDHLGNVRLSYAKSISDTQTGIDIIEENNYYPFGLKHEGYNALVGNPAYLYQYNGKEYQKETGWNDYGARMYMPDIGRWGVVDPLAETTRRFTPYNYALNNPIMFIDPDGRKAISPDSLPEMIGGISTGGAAEYLATGGRAHWGSFDDFLRGHSPFGYMQNWKSGGGGGLSGDGGNSSIAINRMLSLGGFWQNTGYGFQSSSNINLGYDGSYLSLNTALDGYINIPGLVLTANKSNWAGQFIAHFTKYLNVSTGKNINDYFGLMTAPIEAIPGSFRVTNGAYNGNALSLKYYRSGWAGGSRARITTYNIGKVGKALGKFGFGLGAVLDLKGSINYFENPKSKNAVHPGKAVLNTAMGYFGLRISPIAGLFYSGIDTLYPGGWTGDDEHPGVLQDQSTLNQENSFNPYWQIWPGAMKY